MMSFQQVYRNADLSRSAARLFFHFPILWLTGTYSLTNSKVFRFIPSKDREGSKERKGGSHPDLSFHISPNIDDVNVSPGRGTCSL